ncbi:formyltransferase family protein [Zunongwangia sp. F363]|uniref:Formyltransferase family protein n=1 Tax=Autumnicola tepida TaxID=3075595 RepID=A0ABU3C7B8_9FLAO|nr:formyltransferase family protein [Zunongwangia sp. F363]MDT0642194.1 formyltransferase family protein [Zunongwangia sp. F363]
MKTTLFCNSLIVIPLLKKLVDKGDEIQLITPQDYHQELDGLMQTAEEHNIPLLEIRKDELNQEKNLLYQWVEKSDLMLGYTFPWILPEKLFSLCENAVNVHFSSLPYFRGSDPVYWHLKSGEKKIGITFHRLTDIPDEGSIIYNEEIDILPGENYGLLQSRLSYKTAEIFTTFLSRLESNREITAKNISGSYFSRPSRKQRTINWEIQCADEIENLVNACNPKYCGAMAMFRNMPVQIIEVSPADLGTPPVSRPGTIIFSDPTHGIFVLCRDFKVIKINVLKTKEGIFSSAKLAIMGCKKGEIFS